MFSTHSCLLWCFLKGYDWFENDETMNIKLSYCEVFFFKWFIDQEVMEKIKYEEIWMQAMVFLSF